MSVTRIHAATAQRASTATTNTNANASQARKAHNASWTWTSARAVLARTAPHVFSPNSTCTNASACRAIQAFNASCQTIRALRNPVKTALFASSIHPIRLNAYARLDSPVLYAIK